MNNKITVTHLNLKYTKALIYDCLPNLFNNMQNYSKISACDSKQAELQKKDHLDRKFSQIQFEL